MRLLYNDSGFEVNVGNWVIGTGTSFARSTAQFRSGAASGLLTSNGNAVCTAVTNPKTLYHVSEDDRIVISGFARAGTSTRTCKVGVTFYNAALVAVGSPVNTSASVPSGSWTGFSEVRSVIPAYAVYAVPFLEVDSSLNTEQFFFDDLSIYTLDAAFLPSVGMTAAQARRALGALIQTPGVIGHDSDRDSDDSQLQVVERARGRQISVDVLPGVGYCRGTSQPNEGTYGFYNSSRVNVPLEDPDQFDPRIDHICARIYNSHTTALVNTQLSAQDSTFEGGIGTWAQVGGCAVAANATNARSGTGTLRITCITAVFQGAQTATGVSGYPCSAGSTLNISGYVLADNSPSRFAVFGVDFWDGSGNKVGYTTGGTFVAAHGTTSQDYTQMPTFDALVPVGAVTCSLSYVILGAVSGEVHRLDDIVIHTTGVGDDRWQLFPVEGVPGSSPVAPSLPPSSLSLGKVYVKAKAKAIHQADITDTRVFMASFGQSFYSKDGTGRVLQGGIKAVHTDSNGHAFLPYPEKFNHQVLGVKVQPADWGGPPPGPPSGQYPLRVYPTHAQGVAGINLLLTEAVGTVRRPLKQGFVALWWQALGK